MDSIALGKHNILLKSKAFGSISRFESWVYPTIYLTLGKLSSLYLVFLISEMGEIVICDRVVMGNERSGGR